MKEQFIHINKYGTKRYYSDREMTVLHREDGPAVQRLDGSKEYYRNGQLHNENGPAFVSCGGFRLYKQWWLNDERLTEEEFNARMNPVELTLDEIAAKFGVSVDRLKVKK